MNKYNSIVITLYKGRYKKSNEEGIQYRTFGEFDYIKISDAPISKDENKIDYFKLWERTEEASKSLNVGESCHNLYAYSLRENYNKEFWNDRKPYFFASLLQGIQIKEKIKELEKFLYKMSFKYKKFNFAIYYSLDSCDFIVFIKSTKYEIGAKQIHRFPMFCYNEKIHNNYCYSICGIDFDELLASNENEVFEKVMVCFVVKKLFYYQNWYRSFSDVFPEMNFEDIKRQSHFNYNRLGNEDVCINILKCNIKKLISEMKEGGCLCPENEDFRNGIMKLRIHFDNKPYIHEFPVMEERPECNQKDTNSYIDMYQNDVVEEAKRQLYPFVKKALEEVLKACSYLEEENFASDLWKCIKNAIKMLFTKMNEFWIDDGEKEVDRNQIVYNESVVKVVQGIMSIVNGSLHTDKMFFQSPGFNAVLYDIPVKILAFYNHFVEQLVNTLNDKEDKSFCYLLCPDLYLSIKIQKLFDIKNEYPIHRFLLGKIPVKAIFEPKRLMQELAHEVAHCVGDNIRKRERRFVYTIAMLAETIATSMLSPTDDSGEAEQIFTNIYDKLGEERKNKLHEKLVEKIKQYFKEEFETNENTDDFLYYQVNTSCFFDISTKKLLVERSEMLLAVIDSVIKRYYKETNRGIFEYIQDMLQLSIVLQNNIELLFVNAYSIIKAVHTLTNESFADLIMCEVLGVQMDEYVDLFYNTHKEEIDDPASSFLNFSSNATAERIISVVNCYGKKIGELQSTISHATYREYKQRLMFYSEEKTNRYNKESKRILPPAVIRNNIKYLRECHNEIKKKEEKLEILRSLYNSVIYEDIQSSVNTLLNSRR